MGGAGGIEWVALGERGGEALVVAKAIVAKRPYHSDRSCASWEACALRGFLGEGQFLLSLAEALRYFPDDASRVALYQGLPRAWWLRDIGIRNHAAFVGKDGQVSAHGYRVDCTWCGVRPAKWVKV
jgi:hypothetical protein